MEHPILFISYSWDNEEHKIWVLNLANRLRKDGVDVILDRYYLRPGKNLPFFVENSLRRCNRIMTIHTPNYKLKADNRKGGVGQEYSIINNGILNNITENERLIPVLRSGTVGESIPSFLQQFIYVNFKKDDDFEKSYEELLREIYKEPKIRIPELGRKPNFRDNDSIMLSTSEPITQSEPDLIADGLSNNYQRICEIIGSFLESSYSERKKKAALVFELAPKLPLREILKFIDSKNVSENIAAAICLKSYMENLVIDLGGNPNVRSFVSFGINSESSFLRYRVADLIGASQILQKDYQQLISKRIQKEDNNEVISILKRLSKKQHKERLVTPISEKEKFKEEVRGQLSEGNTKQALDSLLKISDNNISNEVIILRSQFSRMEKYRLTGIISLEETNIKINQINSSILTIIDEI